VSRIGRRAFLTGSAAVLGAGAGAAAAAEVNSSHPASVAPADVAVPSPSAQWQMSQAQLAEREPFKGVHQAGILTSRQAQSTFAALDCFAPDRDILSVTLQALSQRAQQLAAGGAGPAARGRCPSGRLGNPGT